MKAYCITCKSDKEYEVVFMNKSTSIINKILKFPLKMAFCKTCSERMYTTEIIEENLKVLNKAYAEI